MAALLLLHEEIERAIQRYVEYRDTKLFRLHEEPSIQRYEEYLDTKLKDVRADLDEARSRMRLSCLCKDMRKPIYYPLTNRILEMARERAV